MNDPEKITQRDHWQAIAEQLGLSSEPEVEQPRAEPARSQPVAKAPPAPIEEEKAPGEGNRPFSPDEELVEEVPEKSPAANQEQTPPEESDTRERPRRGRRRRGSKSESEDGERRSPRRGRGRKPRPEGESAAVNDELPSEEAAPAESPEDDDEEIPKISDWNVPSWNDLIASLYRPDR